MSTTTEVRVNPYVGPREFHDDEAHLFFGRSKEVLELTRLLVAERIVLCHSPSGAGKTSLIRTSLREQLTKRRFTVLPMIRVSHEMRPEVPTQVNRFVVSTLRYLETFFSESERLSLEELHKLSLRAYVEERLRGIVGTKRIVLIFDQFEEILLLDPLDLNGKRVFFEQLGELLADERLWALFAIREDYVASLEPFVEAIPSRFAITYRLPLLEHGPALEAIQKPALAMGVTFANDAAAKLADDLRRVRTMRADNTPEERLGPFIEPVQLQVVCLRLWERLAPEATIISVGDIETAFEGVDEALAGYYNENVTRIAKKLGVSERLIRAWFNDKLITDDGIRAQVRQGQDDSEGLPNTVVSELINVHLVRAERERGGIWLELAHDRLIEPIHQAYNVWRKDHLSTLQQRALIWSEQGRPEGLLLSGQALIDAQRWAASNDAELTDIERQFLRACRAERNRRRVFIVLGAFLVIATVVALYFSYRASEERQIAEEQRRIAEEQRAIADGQRSTAVSEASNAQIALVNASTAQSLAQTAQIRAESEAATAQAALSLVQTAQSQTESSANQQAAIRLAANQLTALEGDDPDQALALALGGLTAPVESPQLDLLLSRAADASGTRFLLPGDTNEVLSVAVSPDGRLAYTGNRSGIIRIWNLASGSLISSFRAHRGGVQEILFSPDGRLIGTASDDRTIRIWDAGTRVELHRLGPLNGPVTDIDFDSGSETLLASSEQGPVQLWSINEQKLIREFPDTGPGLAFNPDGNSAVMVERGRNAQEKALLLLDIVNGAELGRFVGHERIVHNVAFTKDGRTLLSAGRENTIRIWDVKTKQPLQLLEGHTATVWSFAVSPDESKLLSSSADNTIRLWNLRTGEELRRYTGHTGSVYEVTFTREGDRFVSAAEDGQGRVWDVASRQELAVLEGAEGSLQAVAINPAGTEIVASAINGTIYRWSRLTGEMLSSLHLGSTPVFGVAYSPDGSTIAFSRDDGLVRVIPAEGGEPLWSNRQRGQIPSVMFSEDGQLVLAGAESGALYLWSANDGRLVRTFIGLRSVATGAVISKDSLSVVASSEDWTVRRWDVATGNEVMVYTGHRAGVLSVAISPDNQIIASGGTDRQVILWNAASGEVQQRLIGHAAGVWGVAFSSDGALLVSGSADRTVRVWDVSTGREIRRFTGHTQRVWAVAFIPDGSAVVSVSADQTVRLWRLESRQELIDWIRANRYIPPLTCDQIELYRLAGPCADTTVLELTPTPSP